MRKNIIRILFLVLFFTMINFVNSYAEVVEKEYEGDASYGIKCIHNDKNNDLKVEVENRDGIGTHVSNITISGEKLCVTDTIYLDFVSLGPQTGAFWIYSGPDWKPVER